MTDFSRLSRFAMTFGPLTDDLGADVLTWFLAGFPAKTLVLLERAPELPESEADSGWKWRESSVKYDRAMRLWKTRQCSLFEDSEWFSETWPRWGLMRDGECWELPMSARPTFARGSGLLPTIRSTDGERGGRGDLIQAIRGNPNSHYRMWPTLTAGDSKASGSASYSTESGRHSGTTLTDAVVRLPTPNATDYKGPSTRSQGKERPRSDDDLPTRIGGSLNPTWVEWLMGWPLGWTDLRLLETDKSRNALP
jgi:hypothetical protein